MGGVAGCRSSKTAHMAIDRGRAARVAGEFVEREQLAECVRRTQPEFGEGAQCGVAQTFTTGHHHPAGPVSR